VKGLSVRAAHVPNFGVARIALHLQPDRITDGATDPCPLIFLDLDEIHVIVGVESVASLAALPF